jgi:hypothetical protein
MHYEISLLHSIHTGSGAYPASYTTASVIFSSGIKRQRREPDHSPPYSAEVQISGAIHSPIRLRGVELNYLSIWKIA